MAWNPSGDFSWRITEFTRQQLGTTIYSDVFTVGGCNWKILVYPKGSNTDPDNFKIYLEVANPDSLPTEWRIKTKFSLTLVNQFQTNDSIKQVVTETEFSVQQKNLGFPSFIKMAKLRDSSKGFVVNDTLVVKAEVLILNQTNRVDTFFTNLEMFISDDAAGQGQNSAPKAGLNLKSQVPSLEEVEIAKKSLKECLSDIFKLNMKDRMATSLETLSRAEIGLSSEEQKAVELFWGEFDDFVSDFLIFEQDNSEFELQKLKRDQMFSSIKRNHTTYISNKRLIDDLLKEEEEHRKKMEEAISKRIKLMSDSDALMEESVETKAKYTVQTKKVELAEEKKRIAEERMSRSTSAWSSLKAHFVSTSSISFLF